MGRFKNTKTGVVVGVDDSKDHRFGTGWEEAGAPAASEYDGLTVPELKDEIAKRNEGRGDADLLATTGHKADLVAALTTDDDK